MSDPYAVVPALTPTLTLAPTTDQQSSVQWLAGPFLVIHHQLIAERISYLPPTAGAWHDRPALENADLADAFLRPYLDRRPAERLLAVLLDAELRILGLRVIGEGSEQTTVMDTKGLVRAIAATNACAILLAHNHPSGNTTPSKEDVLLTKTVMALCGIVGTTLVDHVILGAMGSYYSFAVSQPEILEPPR